MLLPYYVPEYQSVVDCLLVKFALIGGSRLLLKKCKKYFMRPNCVSFDTYKQQDICESLRADTLVLYCLGLAI